MNRSFNDVSDRDIVDISQEKFIKNMGLSSDDLTIDGKLIFVMTPFNNAFTNEFNVIRDTCNRVGFKCVRGDEENISGNILPHIIKQIIKSKVVIANINGRNPNVFYELGIAHALNKPTIILSRNKLSIPFDIKSQRIVFYESDNELDSLLRDALLKSINA